MKTAEVWANEIRYDHNHGGIDTVVRQIQLDAMKEGARRAAEAVHPKGKPFLNSVIYINTVTDAKQSILTTAENWTIKNL